MYSAMLIDLFIFNYRINMRNAESNTKMLLTSI